jgi:transposase-like protein
MVKVIIGNMIIDEITYTCRRCGSANLIRNGRNRYGSQQFRCKDCGKSAVLQPKNRYTEAEKERILAAYRERPSMRGIARIFGISRNTLAVWLKKSSTTAVSAGDLAASRSG